MVSRALEGLDGVDGVQLRFEEGELEVRHDPRRVSEDDLLAAVRACADESGKPFVATIGGSAGAPPAAADALTEAERARLDLAVISRGEAVDLEEHLVAGKLTLFDYYADWCGPCAVLGRDLERMALERGDVAIRKIDIIDWKSPAARQATADYQLPGLPYVRVYGPQGEFLGAVTGNDPQAVRALLESR